MVKITIPHNGEARKLNHFYVYIIFRRDGTPCYVGKGCNRRWRLLPKHRNNPHLRRIANNSDGELPTVVIRSGLIEDEAFETEIALIKAIGRTINGGPLVNLTDGGEGPSGLVHSQKTLDAIAAKNRGKKRSPEVGRAISLAKKGQPRPDLRGVALEQDHKEKIRLSVMGKNKGKVASDETRKKMSAARLGVRRGPHSDAQKIAIGEGVSRALKGVPKTESHRAAMRKPKSPAHREALRLVLIKRHQRKRHETGCTDDEITLRGI